MRLVNVLSAFLVNLAAVYISVGHTFDLFSSVGFTEEHAIAATFMGESMFIIGGWNITFARLRGHKPSVPSYLGFYFGLALVAWSNIAATYEHGLKGWLLSASVVIAVLLTEAILTAETKSRDASREHEKTQKENRELKNRIAGLFKRKKYRKTRNIARSHRVHDKENQDIASATKNESCNIANENSRDRDAVNNEISRNRENVQPEESRNDDAMPDVKSGEKTQSCTELSRGVSQARDIATATNQDKNIAIKSQSENLAKKLHDEISQNKKLATKSRDQKNIAIVSLEEKSQKKSESREMLRDIDEIIKRAREYEEKFGKSPSINKLAEYAGTSYHYAREAKQKMKG